MVGRSGSLDDCKATPLICDDRYPLVLGINELMQSTSNIAMNNEIKIRCIKELLLVLNMVIERSDRIIVKVVIVIPKSVVFLSRTL